jgi:ParB-like chromosome segregation protein Spo0J
VELLQLKVDHFPPEDGSVAEPSKELIASIALRGQLVPMIVEKVDPKRDDYYRISDGRRRKLAIDAINAARQEDGFGEKLMPYWVVVMDTDQSESNMRVDALHTLTANLLRERNEAMEASAIGMLTDDGHGHEDIAKELNISKSTVAQLDDIRRKLSPEAWGKLEQGKMSFSTAKRLLRLDAGDQAAVVSRANGSRITGKSVNEVRREKRQDLLAGLPTVQAARPETLLAGQLEGFAQRATLSSEQRQILDRAVELLKSLHGS